MQELDGIFASVRQGIVLLDRDGRVIRANSAFEELPGGPGGEGRTLLGGARGRPGSTSSCRARPGAGGRQSEELDDRGQAVLCTVERMAGREELIVVLQRYDRASGGWRP